MERESIWQNDKKIETIETIEEIEEIEKFILPTFQISIAFMVCRLTIRDG